jgi:hypothetical protein
MELYGWLECAVDGETGNILRACHYHLLLSSTVLRAGHPIDILVSVRRRPFRLSPVFSTSFSPFEHDELTGTIPALLLAPTLTALASPSQKSIGYTRSGDNHSAPPPPSPRARPAYPHHSSAQPDASYIDTCRLPTTDRSQGSYLNLIPFHPAISSGSTA